MRPENQAFKMALAAARELPPKLRRQLTRHLLAVDEPQANVTVVYLQRLSPAKQSRLATLMDKSNEGQLKRAEKSEFKRLGAEVDQILLENSQALAFAMRPELFDERGRLIKDRFKQAPSKMNSG